jgi:hypothetical protein
MAGRLSTLAVDKLADIVVDIIAYHKKLVMQGKWHFM